MHQASVAAMAVGPAAAAARQGGRAALAQALQDSRADTLASWAVHAAALPGLQVPVCTELNPPLWELGHIGWFQAYWLQRFGQGHLGFRADAQAPRGPAVPADADSLYDSSRVPHASRWQLSLPDADSTHAQLQAQLAATLALLADSGRTAEDDAGLYFFRLALLHEDMHHEAGLYMAQALGLPLAQPRWQPAALPVPPPPLDFEADAWDLGSPAGQGFAFDNEWPAHRQPAPACQIDAQVLRWAEYLPFVEAGCYAQPQWWSQAGVQWLHQHRALAPRYLQADAALPGGWRQWRHGRWQRLQKDTAACHLTLFEAQAWCRWAGRRLPSEVEWERAACSRPEAFAWGQVWEWTASPFAPYPGFRAHPYREYSAPWFDGRPVLRGASFMSQPRLRHPRYRNFFQPWRNDVPAGLRSCAL